MNQYLENPLEQSFIEDVEEPFIEDEDYEPIIEDSDEYYEFLADEYMEWERLCSAKCWRDLYDEDDYYDFYEEPSSCWTEEDSWWALTDGMYGDCPSNPIAYDAMIDAMGF